MCVRLYMSVHIALLQLVNFSLLLRAQAGGDLLECQFELKFESIRECGRDNALLMQPFFACHFLLFSVHWALQLQSVQAAAQYYSILAGT